MSLITGKSALVLQANLVSMHRVTPHHETLPSDMHWVILRSLHSSEVRIVEENGTFVQGTCIPGHLFLRPAGTKDRWLWENPGGTICFGVHPSLLCRARSSQDTESCPPQLAKQLFFLDSFLSETVKHMVPEYNSGRNERHSYVEALTNAIIFHLLRWYCEALPPARQSVPGLTPRTLKKVTEHITTNLNQRMLIDELAELAGLSAFYFCRLFKQSTGMTPHSYVLQQRVLQAQRVLAESERSITEIGYDLGFTTPSHFAWTFRRYTGTTPALFRRQQAAAMQLDDRSMAKSQMALAAL